MHQKTAKTETQAHVLKRTNRPCSFYAKLEHCNSFLWLKCLCFLLLCTITAWRDTWGRHEMLIWQFTCIFKSTWQMATTAMSADKFLPLLKTRKYIYGLCLTWNTKDDTAGSFFFPFQMFRGIKLPFIIAGIFLFSLFHQDLLTKHQSKILPSLTAFMKEKSLGVPHWKNGTKNKNADVQVGVWDWMNDAVPFHPESHGTAEPQNGWNWKGPLEVIRSNPHLE